MVRWEERWLDKFYRSKLGWLDGTSCFCGLLCKYAEGMRILEIGPGLKGSKTTRYLKHISNDLVGLDIDPNLRKNQLINNLCIYDGITFPFHDLSFDVVVSDYVNEHITNPYELHGEIFRVLKNGGYYLFRTPNKFHYVSIVGLITSHSFHRVIYRWLRKKPEEAHDPYPTKYLFNSEKTCRKILTAVGFKIIEIELIEKEPCYGMHSRALFLAFMGYERLVNYTESLRGLRSNILCVAIKR